MAMRGAELQSAFARAVLDAGETVPGLLAPKAGGTPARRFAVYRNNVYTSLVDALANRFPIAMRLVGDEFFRAMARAYVETDPPRSPVLLRYGEGFAAFVANFPPVAPVPYLADVMRLEWAWHAGYHAADAEPLPLAALKAAAEDAAEARLTLHPSLHVVRSPYPVVTVWQVASREGENEPARLPAEGEDALVIRPRLEVEVRRLPEGGGCFILALERGATIGEAAESAIGEAPAFDLAANLAGLMGCGAFIGVGADP
jgi:hypothetical protein